MAPVALLLVAGCGLPQPSEEPDMWFAEVVAPELPPGPVNQPWEQRPADEGYSLMLLVSSTGMDFSSGERFIASQFKKPDGSINKDVGHCWIVLEGPDSRFEGGHSGEYGKEQDTYKEGLFDAMFDREPDPAAYLWVEMHDGVLLEGNGGLKPTYACRLPITRVEHDAIRTYIDTFDYEVFALRGRGCSDWVVGVAELVGLSIPNHIRIRIPRTVRYLWSEWTLWTDPAYSILEYGSPEVFEDGLRALVEERAVQEVQLDARGQPKARL